ncbi:NAD(P)/FAD-dependent oxidoreductase [Arsenicicoccus cauae]|uniref:NAD(P)/FAD-dependent oxidoreductase n=1 Tax=Arsenicicoccus cauae TaxID=2663847 RepID=UPI00370D7B77
MRRHDLVIIGAGNAGISLAARASRLGCRDVVVIAPGELHRYRPLLNYVAGGQARMSTLTRPTASVLPRSVTWLRGTATAIDPHAKTVTLASGDQIGYHDVVVATGLDPDLPATPGLAEAMEAGWSSSAHLTDRAEDVWYAVRRLRRGRVVFSIPPEPSPCGGTALKPLFLAAAHWRRQGLLGDIDLHLVTPYAGVLDIPFVEDTLQAELDRNGVTVHRRSTVTSVSHDSCAVTLSGDGGDTTIQDVEHAFIVPAYRAPRWLAPLAGDHPAGLVDVDPSTLAHRRHPSLWSLGDVADLRTRPSGGALRRQVEVLAANISLARRRRQPRRYDGYTVIPITTDRHRLMLIEFDRQLQPQPTVSWTDLTRPRADLWFFDRYVEPIIYFHALLDGRV